MVSGATEWVKRRTPCILTFNFNKFDRIRHFCVSVRKPKEQALLYHITKRLVDTGMYVKF